MSGDNPYRVTWLFAAGFFACTPSLHARDNGADGQRAHQHGVAAVKVTLQERQLAVVIEGPAEIIVGFEHAPGSDAQERAVRRARQQLNDQQSLFAVSAAARCEPRRRQITIDLSPPGTGDTHSEFAAEYRWRCTVPGELRYIDMGFLRTFPHAKEFRAQVVTGSGQKTGRLTPGAIRLTLSP